MHRSILFIVAILIALGLPASTHAQGTMTYHGGEVMHTSTTYAIFWLPPGSTYEQAGGDNSRFESLVGRFLRDVGGTSYYNILTQYSKDASGETVKDGPILNHSTFAGSYVDTTPYPHAGTENDPLTGTDIQTAITRAMQAQGWTPGLNKIYYLYAAADMCVLITELGQTLCSFPSSAANAPAPVCAISYGFQQNQQSVLYNALPVTASNPCAALRPSATESPTHDPDADLAILGTANLLFGSVVNTLGTGWFADNGNGDIWNGCVTTTTPLKPLVLHGDTYLLQAMWSNHDSGCVYSYKAPNHKKTCKKGYKLRHGRCVKQG